MATSRSLSMCIRPSAAGTINIAPTNRNAYSASGSTRKPTSTHSGANTMQKPATILRKWWASEIPDIEPSLLWDPVEPGQEHLHLGGLCVTTRAYEVTPLCHVAALSDTRRTDERPGRD